MAKTFSKISLIILFFFISFIGYFSLVGFKTKNFNTQIKENLIKIDPNFDIKLNDVKLVLNLFSLRINAKTLGPIIYYNNRLLDIELIKSDISLSNLINKKFSLSNLFISTKSIKLKDMVAFLRAISATNKAELFMLENFIGKGYLIADVDLNFDDKGKIKEDLKISGLVKDGSIRLLNKKKIDKIDFIFAIQNKNLEINDLKLSYEKINFESKKISLKKNDKYINIEGEIENNKVSLSEKILKDLFDPFLSIDLKNLDFSSKNKFKIKLDEKLGIVDYKLKLSLNIEELSIVNDFNLKNIFPNQKSIIKFSNHQTEIIYQKNNFLISGTGDFLVQDKFDKADYKIKKNKDHSLFDVKLNLNNNFVNLDLLNYKINDNSEATLRLKGNLKKNKSLNLKKIEFTNGSDLIIITDLELTKHFKIFNLKTAVFDFIDLQNKKNIFQIYKNKETYVLSGKVLNASKLIGDLIFEEKKNREIFDEDFSLEIDIKEVYLHKDYITYNLEGNLNLKDNNVVNANINSQFNEKDKLSFNIIRNNNQKVTTLYSDQAKPFVKKFNFIKGFDKGSLDFYSVKSKNITNSKLKIYDFKLKELPVLTKILTLASLQGIADLLSGEGIGFSEFEMNFQNKSNIMTIEEIYAIGPAISILMEGYVEKNKLVSLRGTLVPATTINKAIGSIPIIGNILVGKKTGEGVFGVSFKIKGPPKKLETSVNPIKTLTPRFITRTLEKIKKN